jgi:integrase
MLTRAMERYVELYRAGGFKFDEQNNVLKSFVAFATAASDEVVRSDRVLEWIALTPSARRRRILLRTVRRFALTLKAEDPRHEVPAANAFGRAAFERRSPHIYTTDEIARLMRAAEMPILRSIAPVTCVALFGLLAATGLRISEAIALQCRDISEDGLVIRNSKRRTNRLVPLHETTRKALDAYLSIRKRQEACDGPLFVSVSGRALLYETVNRIFRQLIQSTGLRNETGQRNPRIHDLRHTFAVRSLERCGHDRDAVARHIVALSTYLGHASVTGTYWYLEATPGVLRQIADASESLHRRGAP